MAASLHAVAVYTYWQVAHQHHSLLPGIVGSLLQLAVQQVLYKIDKVGLWGFRVCLQPPLILADKVLEVLRCHHTFTLFGKEFVEVFVLHPIHSLVVAIRQCVQFLTAALKLRHPGFRLQLSGSLQVNVVWMQGKSTHDVVGERVVPVSVGSGIVYGQQLYHPHTSLYSPVNESLQVAEVAHSITVFRAQREYRHSHSGSTPSLFGQSQMSSVEHYHLSVGQLSVPVNVKVIVFVYTPVVAFLPLYQFVALVVHHHIFIFYRQKPAKRIHREEPFVTPCILHQLIAAGAP